MANVEAKTLRRARSLRRNLTDAETILWSRLRKGIDGIHFRRQHPLGLFIADFACIRARLIVEVDGVTHSTNAELAYDARRKRFMHSRDWQVIRVTNTDVYKSLDDVLQFIHGAALARL